MEIIIAKARVTSVPRGPESPEANMARRIATFLPLPSLLSGARVLHDEDERLTALQLPTQIGSVLVVVTPDGMGFTYTVIHEAETGRRSLGSVREDRRFPGNIARVVAYRVAEFLRTRYTV